MIFNELKNKKLIITSSFILIKININKLTELNPKHDE